MNNDGSLMAQVGQAGGDSAASAAAAVGINTAMTAAAVPRLPIGRGDEAGSSPGLRQPAQQVTDDGREPEAAGTVRKQLQMPHATEDSGSKGGASSPVKGLVTGPGVQH
jgi:hypothetical protein